MKTLSFELRYYAASSALANDDITLRMMVDTTCTTPFFIIGCPRLIFLLRRSARILNCTLFDRTGMRHHCGLQESCRFVCTG